MTKHTNLTLSSEATLLSPAKTHSGVDIIVQNNGTADVFVGSSAVSIASYGFRIASGSAISLRLGGKDELYGVSSGSSPVAVLIVGLA